MPLQRGHPMGVPEAVEKPPQLAHDAVPPRTGDRIPAISPRLSGRSLAGTAGPIQRRCSARDSICRRS
jgi:hypothetical protein